MTTQSTTIEAGLPLSQRRARAGAAPSPALPRALDDRCPTCTHPVYEHRLEASPDEFDTIEGWWAFLRRFHPGCVLCRCERTLYEPGPADYAELERSRRVSDLEREDEMRREA